MMKMSFLLLALVGLFGCGVRAPMVHSTSTSIAESTPQAIALQVEFEISNTNDAPLHLRMYEYTVTANGRTVYKGKASAEQTVPRWSAVSNSIPVVLRRDDLQGTTDVAWRLSGSLGYVASNAISETLFNAGLWKTTTPFRAHGSISIPPIN